MSFKMSELRQHLGMITRMTKPHWSRIFKS